MARKNGEYGLYKEKDRTQLEQERQNILAGRFFPKRQRKQQYHCIHIQPIQDMSDLHAPRERQLRVSQRINDKTDGGSWKKVKTVGSSTTSWKNTGLTKGTAYTYTVRAYCTVDGTKVLGGYDKTGVTATAK